MTKCFQAVHLLSMNFHSVLVHGESDLEHIMLQGIKYLASTLFFYELGDRTFLIVPFCQYVCETPRECLGSIFSESVLFHKNLLLLNANLLQTCLKNFFMRVCKLEEELITGGWKVLSYLTLESLSGSLGSFTAQGVGWRGWLRYPCSTSPRSHQHPPCTRTYISVLCTR